MDHPLSPQERDLLIEDALRTYPMPSPPQDITADVMSRIQAVPVPRPFAFRWSDILLGVVVALCLSALWFSLQNLPPLMLAQLRKESILFYQYLLVNARWLIPAISFGLAACLAALTLPYLHAELMKKSA